MREYFHSPWNVSWVTFRLSELSSNLVTLRPVAYVLGSSLAWTSRLVSVVALVIRFTNFQAGQRMPAPVLSDPAEQAVFNLVPFADAVGRGERDERPIFNGSRSPNCCSIRFH